MDTFVESITSDECLWICNNKPECSGVTNLEMYVNSLSALIPLGWMLVRNCTGSQNII